MERREVVIAVSGNGKDTERPFCGTSKTKAAAGKGERGESMATTKGSAAGATTAIVQRDENTKRSRFRKTAETSSASLKASRFV